MTQWTDGSHGERCETSSVTVILKPQREEMGENAEKIRLAKAMEKLENFMGIVTTPSELKIDMTTISIPDQIAPNSVNCMKILCKSFSFLYYYE